MAMTSVTSKNLATDKFRVSNAVCQTDQNVVLLKSTVVITSTQLVVLNKEYCQIIIIDALWYTTENYK